MNLSIELLKHNTMMNDRLIEVCRRLTDEQLESTVEGTYGTIGATLVHVADAQRSYAARFFGGERPQHLAETPFPGFAALTAAFDDGNRLLVQAAAEADTDGYVIIDDDDPDTTWRMHRSLLLLQAINHGTEHRSQIATILTQLGITAPEMDGWTFFFDANHMEKLQD
ncbi:MAG: DinB family protein [Acidimicrobiia bacterium]|nr:DinB family protein [Acidimicrobiia bacterium]MDH5504908.1 DinB family protein [Acidimicrobiia bacterium]